MATSTRHARSTALVSSALFLLSRTPGVKAVQRSIGAQDPIIKGVVDTCFALPNTTIGYGAGKCPQLIDCIMDNLSGSSAAGLSAGTSIVSLLPTILALVGELEPIYTFPVPISIFSTTCLQNGLFLTRAFDFKVRGL